MLTTKQLVEIRRRCDAATPGPWSSGDDGDGLYDSGGRLLVSYLDDQAFVKESDADFCAHARTDIPALLSHINELTAERDALAALVAELRHALELMLKPIPMKEIPHDATEEEEDALLVAMAEESIRRENTARAALSRTPGDAVRRAEALERLWAAWKACTPDGGWTALTSSPNALADWGEAVEALRRLEDEAAC